MDDQTAQVVALFKGEILRVQNPMGKCFSIPSLMLKSGHTNSVGSKKKELGGGAAEREREGSFASYLSQCPLFIILLFSSFNYFET